MEFTDIIELIEPQKKQIKPKTECCGREMTKINSMITCMVCGDCYEYFAYIVQTKTVTLNKHMLYKRRSYFKHLILLISCKKICFKSQYNDVVNSLRNKNIHNLKSLRRQMKVNKLHKFYPYMFLIYRDLTGKKLIQLTHSQIGSLLTLFNIFERKVKKQKQNFYSYFLIINRFFIKMKFDGVQYIEIPASNKKLLKEVDQILFTINI